MGKNTAVLTDRAMRYRSCFELVSLLCMNRTLGVGRHTSVIPEAPGAGAVGSRHRLSRVIQYAIHLIIRPDPSSSRIRLRKRQGVHGDAVAMHPLSLARCRRRQKKLAHGVSHKAIIGVLNRKK